MTTYTARLITTDTQTAERPWGVFAAGNGGEYLDGTFASEAEAQGEAARRGGEDAKPKTRTITLTDRSPVKIREDQWPTIASAKRWDNRYECQANRTWTLRVRQHEDGRAIVYAAYDSQYEGEHGKRAGELLDAGADIPAAIRRVGEQAGCGDCIDGCIADLPAIELE